MPLPLVGEEYAEYVDVLTAVEAYVASAWASDARDATTAQRCARPFAFVELGAGYGHWTATAHVALKKRYPLLGASTMLDYSHVLTFLPARCEHDATDVAERAVLASVDERL